MEIKFTGIDFVAVRKEIQEFAIHHLNMKFGATETHTQDGVTFKVEQQTADAVVMGVDPAHFGDAVQVEQPAKRKPGRKPGFSPKRSEVAAVLAQAPTPPPQAPVSDVPQRAASPLDDWTHPVAPLAPPTQNPVASEDEAMAAIQKVQDKHGLEKAKNLVIEGILPKFGVKRGRDLKPEQRAAFIQYCEAAVHA